MTREGRRLHASRVFLGLANSSNASDTGRPVLFGDFPGTMTEFDFSLPCIIGFDFSPSRSGPVDSERGRG
jgi:hypothetical protein